MIKALLLIFIPARAWNGVAEDKPGMWFVLLFHLIPLLAITFAAEGYGLSRWGKERGGGLPPMVFADAGKIEKLKIYGAAQLAVSLAVVLISAQVIQMFATASFHCRKNFAQTFVMVAYGLGPMFLCQVFNVIPFLPWWVAWGVGMVLSISVLYQGVPRMMEPDPPQAFGLYVTTAFALSIVSGVGRLLTAWWLDSNII